MGFVPARSDTFGVGFRYWTRPWSNYYHRIAGPAVEWDDGRKDWFIRGSIQYSQTGLGGQRVSGWEGVDWKPKSLRRGPKKRMRFPGYGACEA